MIIDDRKSGQDPAYEVTIVEIVINENIVNDENLCEDVTCRDVLNVATDCCDAAEEDDLDKVSTDANLDKNELPLIQRIRIFLTEKRNLMFPLLLIFSGGLTSLISVS